MKCPAVFLCVAFTLLAGCATLNESDRAALTERRVSAAIVERMTHREALELADITELSQKGLTPQFIIRYLRSTVHAYPLNSQDVVRLRQAGVHTEVIDYLMTTPSLHAVRYEDPWPRYEPQYYFPQPVVFVRDRGRRR